MAFYRQESESFIPTSRCIGPWNVELQHGGPPAALLAGAAERFGDDGIAPVLPLEDFVFLNPDLTVHVRRPPESDWIALAARSIAEPVGTGLVQSVIFDEQGEVGHCLESLVVRACRGP